MHVSSWVDSITIFIFSKQKYRMHKRHILPKEEDRRWPNQRDIMQRSYYVPRPTMAYPPYHSNHAIAPAPIYPMWGQPGSQPAGVQMWAPPNYHLLQPFPGVLFLIRSKLICVLPLFYKPTFISAS